MNEYPDQDRQSDEQDNIEPLGSHGFCWNRKFDLLIEWCIEVDQGRYHHQHCKSLDQHEIQRMIREICEIDDDVPEKKWQHHCRDHVNEPDMRSDYPF